MRTRRQALGQHFLHDPNIVRKILAVAQIAPDETVVEIGPGRGVLTRPLSRVAQRLFAVELDARLVDGLKTDIEREGSRSWGKRVELIRADALTFAFESLPAPFVVVANLPYAISTPLLFRLLKLRGGIDRMVLMVQLEVARRITAPVGGRDYGPLSIGIQYATRARLEFIVPRGCFSPPPSVDSAVISLDEIGKPRVPVRDEPFFFRVVRGAFAHRRKSLRNALKHAGFPVSAVEEGLRTIGPNGRCAPPGPRPQTLTIEEWALLADKLFDITRKI